VNAPGTRALIEQARSREAALTRVSALMAQARGTAHAFDGTVEVTVARSARCIGCGSRPR
jgi:hypothetical protein